MHYLKVGSILKDYKGATIGYLFRALYSQQSMAFLAWISSACEFSHMAHSLFHHSQHSDTSHKYNLQVPVSFLQQHYNKSEERVPTYKLDNTSGKKATHQVPQHDAQISNRQHVCFFISVEGASRIDRHCTHFHHRHFQHNNYVRSECLILFFSFERRSFSHICLLDHVSEVSLSPCFLTGNGRKRKENTTKSPIVSIFSNMTRSRFYF